MMRVIGITGGIGSGKSTVSEMIREMGYEVADADEIAREITKESDVLSEIGETFGSDLIEGGSLDRKKMADVVFSDIHKRELLEQIITKRVVEKVAQLIDEHRSGSTDYKNGILFIDAPTLFETGADRLVDEVWLVTCDASTRISRAAKRDEILASKIEDRIASQMPEDEKAEKSDVIIDNNGSLEELRKKVESLL